MSSFFFISGAGVVLEFNLGFVLFVTLAHARGLSDVNCALDESDWVFWRLSSLVIRTRNDGKYPQKRHRQKHMFSRLRKD